MLSQVLSTGPFNETPEEYTPRTAQLSLDEAKVLVVGAGGLGCEILKNLALVGFNHIEVIDMDTIDVLNLNRQFLFRSKDVGRPKAEVAAEFVSRKVNRPQLRIFHHVGRIQDKPPSFYALFTCVICGLDSVEARRWINATLVLLVEDDYTGLVPLIDGGTEGFRGQSRVILPRITLCYECLLDMLSSKTTYPVCTIANTPRLPEHCIEWALTLLWPQNFPGVKFDGDNPEHVDWMYQRSLERAQEFDIAGVTRSLTLGVVKNIVPAIAATNAIIAASTCNEAFKLVTSCNPVLDNYMMYSGDDLIFTYTFAHTQKKNCPICGCSARTVVAQRWWTLQDFIDLAVLGSNEVQLKSPLLTTQRANLYLISPPELEEQTRSNLNIRLQELVRSGEEILVTDPTLPVSMKLKVVFEGPMEKIVGLKELLHE